MTRCGWATSERLIEYHDTEWGVPTHDDGTLFALLLLEGAQGGLSWETILGKREGYRKAFAQFDPRAVTQYGEREIKQLLANPEIVRNRRKVAAAIGNAKAFLAVQQEFGSFDAYLWRFVGGSPVQHCWQSLEEIPSRTETSEALSGDLRRRGFKFVGPTICYAFMQAVGMVNDHVASCFRHAELRTT